MQSNGYIGLLENDTILMRHPKNNTHVKLYRIIALKTFQLTRNSIQGITDTTTALKFKNLSKRLLTETQRRYESYDSMIENALQNKDIKKAEKLSIEKIKIESDMKRLTSEFRKHDYLLDNPEHLLQPKTIEIYTIGGYVQSLDNLDPHIPVWVDHRSRVFDNAKILDGSHITENCIIYDNAIVKNSRIENYVRIHDDAYIESSNIKDLSEVKNSANLKNCILENSALAFENAIVENTIITTGALCRGKSKTKNTLVLDMARIQGDSDVSNCLLQGMSCLLTGTHDGLNFDEDTELESRIGEGEISNFAMR
jgi:carbonic anhydrase/acetyltransferase-like protein (isoleucine patch superfamily)